MPVGVAVSAGVPVAGEVGEGSGVSLGKTAGVWVDRGVKLANGAVGEPVGAAAGVHVGGGGAAGVPSTVTVAAGRTAAGAAVDVAGAPSCPEQATTVRKRMARAKRRMWSTIQAVSRNLRLRMQIGSLLG